jgi:Protein of unknown function (DUF1045)
LTEAANFRYAIYWVPARGHPLWQAGCAWLGRDPESANPGCAPPCAATPWRYGFHATLKAPMRLREGLGEAAFLLRVQRFALARRAFALPRLAVSSLADFMALKPVDAIDAEHPLRVLADACVVELDDCRRPFDAAELETRAAAVADAAGLAHLQRWGYPHVLDRWRFHMTLSDPGGSADPSLIARARRHFEAPLAVPAQVDAMAVFRETAAGAPLDLLCRLPMAR